ncbi:MAG: GNAT family N-acetyltransferase [Bacteroidales bacterium]|jgi:hypothetical protein|nr:GNAT family N-acetyltransferase [Bacteroidales bacterium]
MNNNQRYADFCTQNPDMPVFLQDWWLDIVYCRNWDALFVEQDGRIIAAMPYSIKQKWGFRLIFSPPFTPTAGFWIAYPQGIGQIRKISFENQIMSDFAKQLDNLKIAFYSHYYSFHYTNWFGYYWKSFCQTTRYTYRIDLTPSWESIEAKIHNKTKRVIRISSQSLNVKLNSISVSEFWDTNKKSFDRQSVEVPYSYAIFEAMMTKSLERNLGLALHTTDDRGQIIACLFVVFDSHTCHAVLCGTDPKLRDSNATTLLYYEAIRYAKEKNMSFFDFSGSMIEGVESFYRHFGAEQTPYHLIEKQYSKIYSLLRDIRHR